MRAVLATVAGLGILAALILPQAGEIGDALRKVELDTILALAALQLLAYLLRSESWGLCLTAAGKPIPRRDLHSTSALTFLANTAVPAYAGLWVRVGLLKRTMRDDAPTVGQMVVADGILLLVEALITVVLVVASTASLGLAWYWPVIFTALAVAGVGSLRLVRRRWPDRPFVKTFDVFAGSRERTVLTILLAAVLLIQPLRYWIALRAVGLDASAFEALFAFIVTSILNALPFGPGPATVGATSVVFAGEGMAAAEAGGIVLAGTAVLAAAAYSLWALPTLLPRLGRPDGRAEADEAEPAATV